VLDHLLLKEKEEKTKLHKFSLFGKRISNYQY